MGKYNTSDMPQGGDGFRYMAYMSMQDWREEALSRYHKGKMSELTILEIDEEIQDTEQSKTKYTDTLSLAVFDKYLCELRELRSSATE